MNGLVILCVCEQVRVNGFVDVKGSSDKWGLLIPARLDEISGSGRWQWVAPRDVEVIKVVGELDGSNTLR